MCKYINIFFSIHFSSTALVFFNDSFLQGKTVTNKQMLCPDRKAYTEENNDFGQGDLRQNLTLKC